MSSNTNSLSGINVLNKYSRENAATINEGYFAINARPGDTLVFTNINFVGKNVAVTRENYDGQLLLVNLEAVANQIEEVIVDEHKNINAVDLGILQNKPKSYSKAERGVKAGASFEGQIGTNSAIGLDPLINAITGRGKELKENVVVERKLLTRNLVEKFFTDEFLRSQMQIPEDRIEGFKFFLADDPAFAKAVKAENKTLAKWLMASLAERYNKIEQDDLKSIKD